MSISVLETIVRNKIYNCTYWKEKCFSMTTESLIDNALELTYIGGVVGTTNQPTDFICLLLKLLQLSPQEEIIDEFLSIPDYKYLRALTALYVRLVFPPVKVYSKLEKMYCDYKKLRIIDNAGKFHIIHMDELIDDLLHKETIINLNLPKITKRKVLEANQELAPRVSLLEENDDSDDVFDDINLPDNFFKGVKVEDEEQQEEIQYKENEDNIDIEMDQRRKRQKIEEEKEKNNLEKEEKVLDENSAEYWLELRKKIGLSS